MFSLSGGERMHVFRTGRRRVPSALLIDGLARELRAAVALGPSSQRGLVIGALLRAGELECGMADASARDLALAGSVTDLIADAAVDANAGDRLAAAARRLTGVTAPAQLELSPQEGFTYYGLHPLDFAALIDRVVVRGRSAAVIGIRSIGTTLSAVVAAALRHRGVIADRISVRPEGHPYRRRVALDPAQRAWVAGHARAGSDFIVADEGPGTSGSSFLASAEAVVAVGVPAQRVTLFCSRSEDPERLVAPRAAERWRVFASVAPTDYRQPPQADTWIGAGAWRRIFWQNEAVWPASWVVLERRKFLSADGRHLYKFEGMGRIGREVQERAAILAATGFAPRPSAWDHAQGYAEYPMLQARPFTRADLTPDMLDHMAEYVAARRLELPAAAADLAELRQMLAFNFAEEFGHEAPASLELELRHAVIADGHMMPHEWLRERRGNVYKVDGVSHGDDHLFPGPVDVAWDLAGTIVEWHLDEAGRASFLQRYRRLSGDDARSRLPSYLFAYSLFRAACARMAACTQGDSEEEERLTAEYIRYRAQAEEYLAECHPAPGAAAAPA